MAIGLLLVSAKAGLPHLGSPPETIVESPLQDATPASEFDWLDNLELATSIAAKTQRPLMVVFR